jgi:hypothetical protein
LAGNLSSGVRVHRREQSCGAWDAPDWFSRNRHGS